MRRARAVGAILFALLAVGGGAAYGAGYAIYEQGAKAMALGGAFTARADDPSALFFNPAGILQLNGVQYYAGTTAIILSGSSFTSAASSQRFEQENMIAWPSAAYFTWKINEKMAWGLSVTSPFGLKTQWGPTFEGRDISRESNLAVGVINANDAFRLADHWSAAVGADYAKSDVRELSRNFDLTLLGFPGQEGFSKLTGNGTDLGWNVALRWEQDSWAWGLSYRSKMNPKIDGDIEFEDVPAPLLAAGLFPNGGVTAHIPLPATAVTGVNYRSSDGKGKWQWEVDALRTEWSAFDHLRIDIEKNTLAVADVDQIEEWRDSWSYRLGASYRPGPSHEYRFGAYYDNNPIPNEHVRPRLPDADRNSVQVGYGFTAKSGFFIDAAYQALFFAKRTAEGSPTSTSDPVDPGTYRNFTSLFGVSLGWKH
jgi:long-chain fatty acid transport protein